MLKKIKKFLRKLFLRNSKVKFVDDLPETCKEDIIYIIGSEFKWIIVFLCPCGCKNVIYLNLLKEEAPNWNYTFNKNKLTISPSIRRTKGCKSHFWIKNGKIVWT